MPRKNNILKYINKNGAGIEIGPSYNPIAPKSSGYNVQVMDHLNKDQLIEKYKQHNVNIDKIEEVDFIYNGESFEELTGKHDFYDWL